jgi:ribonuclease J
MLRSLKQNAIQCGIHADNVILVVNGQKVQLLNHVAHATDEYIDADEIYVDGNKINSDSSGLLKYRRILSQDGVFNVTMLVDQNSKKIVDLPTITTRGSFYARTSTSLIAKIAYSIRDNVQAAMNRNNYIINNNEIRRIAENTTEFYI